jgi:hypothetical protein
MSFQPTRLALESTTAIAGMDITRQVSGKATGKTPRDDVP